jgi:hypothetical protein
MTVVPTKYGFIKGITLAAYFDDGNLERCAVNQKNAISLACGTIVPQYKDDGRRKKLVKSMTFYPDGVLESAILQDITLIETGLGRIPAEMITFYEDGTVKRIFPSFGTISAFWTEEDDRELSPELTFDLPFLHFHGKAVNLMFYPSGTLRSMTLWPGDSVAVDTPAGTVPARIGFSLYPNGKIRSVEPLEPVPVSTPIGIVPAYDPDALGADGDRNSLVFSEKGYVQSLLTSEAGVTVMLGTEKIGEYAPLSKSCDYYDNILALEPLEISFTNQTVSFGRRKGSKEKSRYSISECEFLIHPINTDGFCNTCKECCS